MDKPQTERTHFTYAQAYPGGWLHSPELGDKPWTVRIAHVALRPVKNHVTGKTDDLCIFRFANPKTGEALDHEYISSKTNAFICATAFGQWADKWVGHLLTIASVPCDFGPWGSRVSFVGSPDIDGDIIMQTPGQKTMTFRKTKVKDTPIPEEIDPVVENADEDPDLENASLEDEDPAIDPDTLPSGTGTLL